MLGQKNTQRISFEAIGTHWEIDFYEVVTPTDLKEISKQIEQRIAVFDESYSRFRSDSLIMQLAHAPGRYKLPDDARPLLDFYESLYKLTDGKVTPLIGNTLSSAGYDATYSLKPKTEILSAPKWDHVITYDPPYISNSENVIVDFGAAGKGYLIDIVAALLADYGLYEYLVDAGGDMLQKSNSNRSALIGLEHPKDVSLVIGAVEILNESICASAGSRRKWGNLHHIMDPDSARPVREIIATWVLARSAILADGLATALFFTPAARLQEQYNFEYLLVRSDMSLEKSKGLNAEIFGADDE